MRNRLLGEAAGTFAIVFFGCGAACAGGDRVTVNLVFGLVVAFAAAAFGAHMNPAVTLALRTPRREAVPYIAAQCAGAVIASGLHALLLPGAAAARFGATLPAVGAARAFGLEFVGTAFLLAVVVRTKGAPWAAGAVVAALGLFQGPLTGNSLNPARSLGPALFGGGLGSLWIYLLAPTLGAWIGARAAER